MTKALSDVFAEAQAPYLDWEGELAFAIYEMPAPGELIVELMRSKASPVQGLSLKAYGGVLRIDDVESPHMLIWADTAPHRVMVSFKSWAGREARVKIWNVWRGNVGGVAVTQAWLGNAGMRIEQATDGRELLLRCSDGEGPVDFGDLEARVIIA
jgi:hypothetical protein